MSSELFSKKKKKLTKKLLLEMINDIITECSSTNHFLQQKIIRKCDREGISID